MAKKMTVMVSSTFRTVAVMTIITSLIWTALGVYGALKKPSDLQLPAGLLEPVNPTIDTETLQKLTTRQQLTELVASGSAFEEALQIMAIEPTNEPATVATESATASGSATPPTSSL